MINAQRLSRFPYMLQSLTNMFTEGFFITKPRVIFRLFLKDSDEAFPDCASLPFNLQGRCLQVIQVTPGQFTKPMPILLFLIVSVDESAPSFQKKSTFKHFQNKFGQIYFTYKQG